MTVDASGSLAGLADGELMLDQLRDGARQLGLQLEPGQCRQLLDYLRLLHKWNSAYNLSAVRDPRTMLSRHILDSLSIAPFLRGQRFIDVGTGAGLPGIPLAIIQPQQSFVLLDSNGKKTRFLFQAVRELGLTNMDVVQARVENHVAETLFDGIISRAFASLDAMLASSRHLLAPQGKFYAMKGLLPEQELTCVGDDFQLESCVALQVPDCSAARHLIIINLRSR